MLVEYNFSAFYSLVLLCVSRVAMMSSKGWPMVRKQGRSIIVQFEDGECQKYVPMKRKGVLKAKDGSVKRCTSWQWVRAPQQPSDAPPIHLLNQLKCQNGWTRRVCPKCHWQEIVPSDWNFCGGCGRNYRTHESVQ